MAVQKKNSGKLESGDKILNGSVASNRGFVPRENLLRFFFQLCLKNSFLQISNEACNIVLLSCSLFCHFNGLFTNRYVYDSSFSVLKFYL